MKTDEPDAMKEIHRIREEIQEKTGDMSDEQRLAASRAAMERLAREFGMKPRIFEKTHP